MGGGSLARAGLPWPASTTAPTCRRLPYRRPAPAARRQCRAAAQAAAAPPASAPPQFHTAAELPPSLRNTTAVLQTAEGATAYVLGISHVSKESCREIEQLIRLVRPGESAECSSWAQQVFGAVHWTLMFSCWNAHCMGLEASVMLAACLALLLRWMPSRPMRRPPLCACLQILCCWRCVPSKRHGRACPCAPHAMLQRSIRHLPAHPATCLHTCPSSPHAHTPRPAPPPQLCKDRTGLLVDPDAPPPQSWWTPRLTISGVPAAPGWPTAAQLAGGLKGRGCAPVSAADIEDDAVALLATGERQGGGWGWQRWGLGLQGGAGWLGGWLTGGGHPMNGCSRLPIRSVGVAPAPAPCFANQTCPAPPCSPGLLQGCSAACVWRPSRPPLPPPPHSRCCPAAGCRLWRRWARWSMWWRHASCQLCSSCRCGRRAGWRRRQTTCKPARRLRPRRRPLPAWLPTLRRGRCCWRGSQTASMSCLREWRRASRRRC